MYTNGEYWWINTLIQIHKSEKRLIKEAIITKHFEIYSHMCNKHHCKKWIKSSLGWSSMVCTPRRYVRIIWMLYTYAVLFRVCCVQGNAGIVYTALTACNIWHHIRYIKDHKNGHSDSKDGATQDVAPVVHVVGDPRDGCVVGYDEYHELYHRPQQPAFPPTHSIL